MGLFDKLFQKKLCDICGGEIGLLGNRKLADGNLCKQCAGKLSPWFDERRQSTVAQIGEQLAYREENRAAVAQFHTTRSLGGRMKVLLDEDAGKFVVCSARNLEEANPDVLDFSQVTGVDLEVEEDTREDMRKDKDGNSVSYIPKRYFYSYDFELRIRVNHPYFDEIKLRLNDSSVEMNNGESTPRKPLVQQDPEYRKYDAMAQEIKRVLTTARAQAREQAAAAAAPKQAVVCPWCGATTLGDAQGKCEYCGGALNS